MVSSLALQQKSHRSEKIWKNYTSILFQQLKFTLLSQNAMKLLYDRLLLNMMKVILNSFELI